jgi:hypothetical protein
MRAMDNDVWTKFGATVMTDLDEAPDESSTSADLLREDGTNGQHRIEREMPQGEANQPQLVIGYAKPVGRELLWVRSTGRNGTVLHSIFSLTDAGSVLRQDAGHTSSIWLMPNGWYAFRVVLSAAGMGSGATTPLWRFNLAAASNTLSYQGDTSVVRGVELWDLRYHPNTSGVNVEFPEYEVQTPGGGGEPEAHILRVGWMGAQNVLGLGPGDQPGSDSNPIFRVAMFTPNLNNINAKLELAEEKDILLVLNFARSRNNWLEQTASGPVYRHSLYEDEINAWANHAGIALAIKERRVVAYAHDEPNHPDFNDTLSPFLFNEGNRAHKDIWSDVITTNRVNGQVLAAGWGGFDPVEYDGCDYGWIQFAPQHTPAGTPAQIYATHKAALNDLNLGFIPGLNWANGGHTSSVNNAGVDHCWDYNNDGISRGILIGTRDSVFADGQKVPCGDSRITGSTIATCNPGWLRAMLDAVYNDTEAPFFLMWQHPGDTTVNHPNHVAAMLHPQMIAAMRYAINRGAERPLWGGWRPVKTKPSTGWP